MFELPIIRNRRRIVPLSLLKSSVERDAKLAILDRIEGQFERTNARLKDALDMVKMHQEYLDALTRDTGSDHRQNFTDFYLREKTRDV